MNRSTVIRTAAVVGFLAVVLGAFGAHKLNDLLVERKTLSIWETAVLFQFVHLAGFILLVQTEKVSKIAYTLFLTGIICFSGSLYLLAVFFLKPLVYVTPLGGSLLLAGWVALFVSAGAAKKS